MSSLGRTERIGREVIGQFRVESNRLVVVLPHQQLKVGLNFFTKYGRLNPRAVTISEVERGDIFGRIRCGTLLVSLVARGGGQVVVATGQQLMDEGIASVF